MAASRQKLNERMGTCLNNMRRDFFKEVNVSHVAKRERKKRNNKEKASRISTEHICEGKKIKQERKETVKLKFSPKVSHLEGSIVPSLSHREFNFAFPLSILRHTSSLFCVFLFLLKVSLLAKRCWGGHETQVFAYLFCPKFRKDGDVLFVHTSTQAYFSAATIFLVFSTLSF